MNNILQIIDDILDQENNILPKRIRIVIESFDEKLFNRMANFIINLDPDRLSENQVQKIINMIEKLEEEFDDIQEVRLAKRTPQDKNQYSKKWYRTNKSSIKRRKKKMARSSQGLKRAKMKDRLSNIGKTATGRKKVKYHRRLKDKEMDK